MDDGKWKANGTLAGDSDTDRTRRSGMHGHGTSPSGENKGGWEKYLVRVKPKMRCSYKEELHSSQEQIKHVTLF